MITHNVKNILKIFHNSIKREFSIDIYAYAWMSYFDLVENNLQ